MLSTIFCISKILMSAVKFYSAIRRNYYTPTKEGIKKLYDS